MSTATRPAGLLGCLRLAKAVLLRPLPATARVRLRLVRRALVGPLPSPRTRARPEPAPPGPAPKPAPKPRPAPTPQVVKDREVFLKVPPTPGSEPRAALREVHMTAAPRMYVAKVLGRDGFGGYEESSLPHFLAALQGAPAGAVLDIGANVGPYSLLARACSDRQVVAFEPTPDLAQCARVTGARNGLDFEVEQVALGDSLGTATLHLSQTSDSSNSLNPDFRPSSANLEVPLETVDAWVARTGIAPGVLKVDTETTEPEVLRGARDTIARLRPWVFCEVLEGRREDELSRVIADWADYTTYHLTGPGPLVPSTEILGDKEQKHLMWLFVPQTLTDEHWARAAAWREALELAR